MKTIKQFGRRTSLLSIVFVLCAVFLFGCGPKTGDSSGATDGSNASAAGSSDDYDKYEPQDMGGYEFVIYDCARYGDEHPPRGGTLFDDAVWDVKEKIEEDFKCEISWKYFDPINAYQLIYAEIMSGAKAGDVIVTPTFGITSFILSDSLMPWNRLDTINFDSPHWTKEIIDCYTLNGNIYAIGSDLRYLGAKVSGLMYNKDMIINKGFEDPYELVKKDQWTYDAFREMAKAAVEDNGDGKMDQYDKYGIGGPFFNKGFFDASGAKILQKDENGKIQFVMDKDPNAMNAIQWIRDIRYGGDNIFYNIDITQWATWYQMFTNGQIMFIGCATNDVGAGRDGDFERGFVPYPKGPGATSWSSAIETNANVWAIPITNTDFRKTEIIMKALNYQSQINKDAWDEEIYTYYFEGDENMKEMHQLMMENISFGHEYMVNPAWWLFDTTMFEDRDPQQVLEEQQPGIVADLEEKYNTK